jgi:hypothetical protein
MLNCFAIRFTVSPVSLVSLFRETEINRFLKNSTYYIHVRIEECMLCTYVKGVPLHGRVESWRKMRVCMHDRPLPQPLRFCVSFPMDRKSIYLVMPTVACTYTVKYLVVQLDILALCNNISLFSFMSEVEGIYATSPVF